MRNAKARVKVLYSALELIVPLMESQLQLLSPQNRHSFHSVDAWHQGRDV